MKCNVLHFFFYHISLSSWNEKRFGTNLYRKSKHTFYDLDKLVVKLETHFMFHNYFRNLRL